MELIGAFGGADHVITVTEPTPLGAHDFELILKLLDIFELKGSAFLNRADLPAAQDMVPQIAREHHITVAANLNTDDILIKSYVSGNPVVAMFPESPSAMVFVRLARDIAREYLT